MCLMEAEWFPPAGRGGMGRGGEAGPLELSVMELERSCLED